MSATPSTTAPPLDWPHYGIGFIAAVKRGFSKYADFNGRASRSEFWFWYLFYILAVTVLASVTGVLAAATTTAGTDEIPTGAVIGLVLLGLFVLAIALPTLALGARRLHDAGFSALFLLFLLASSFGGGIVLLVMWVLPTSPKAVQYGPPDAPAQEGYPLPYGGDHGYPSQPYGSAEGYAAPEYGAQPSYPTQGYAPAPAYGEAPGSPSAGYGYGTGPDQPAPGSANDGNPDRNPWRQDPPPTS